MDYEENLKFTCIPPPTDNKQQIATLPYILRGCDWQRLPEVANAYTDTELFQKR